MGDDRPNTYIEGDWVIYRASSLGNCIKSLVASRLGIEPMPHPDWLLEKFSEGNVNEPIILNMLKDAGWTITDENEPEQMEVEIQVGSRVKIRGHLDGVGIPPRMATLPEGFHVIEAKAFGKAFWDKYMKEGIAGFPYYAMQVTIYMAALEMPCVFVVGLKDDDGVVTKIKQEVFINPPMSMGQVKAKVAKIEGLVAKGELPGCDYVQYPCQYYLLHEEEAQGDGGVDEDLEVDLLLTNYVRGQELEKEAKELKGPAGEALLKIMQGREVEKIDRLKHVISTVSRANSKVDMAGLTEEVGRDIVQKHTTVTKTQYVKVTEKKQE